MPTPPPSTKASLTSRVNDRARHCWPPMSAVQVRFRGRFAYLDGELPDGETLPLCRLRYAGSASTWGFAIYRASRDDYENSYLPNGQRAGSPEDVLDCVCGLYLNDPPHGLHRRECRRDH
jgi:hypothetical protein